MYEIDVDRWKRELITGGFHPRRFGFFVRQLRRILWPFLRPYHFYTLDTVGRLGEGLRAATELLRQELREETEQRRETIKRVAGNFAILESDLTAAVHRQLALESEFTKLAAKLSQMSTERDQDRERQVAFGSELRNITNQLTVVWSEQTKFSLAADRVARIEQRTKLFLTTGRHGLFLLKEGDVISDTVASSGEWDSHISSLFKEAPAKTGTAVDVGAHFGLISVPMARHFARVISVEPNEFNFALLTANVALNGLGNVQCIKAAMFSHETTLSLAPDEVQEVAIPRNMSGEPAWLECSNLGALVFSPGAGAVGARAQTLDSLGISDLAFLKIDAQGADGEVIAGGIETISRCRPVLVFEWEAELSRNFSVSFEHASKLLVEAGYEITVLKQHNEKQVDYLARSQAS